MIRKTLVALVILFLARAVFADYVVLVGVDGKDPYAKAGKLLAAHHRTKHVIPFDPARPDDVLPALRKIAPENVAIILRPEQIEVNSVRRILRMSTHVDDDPFPDFAYGYVTGATADEAIAFVKRIILADGETAPRRVARASVWGGKRPCVATDDTYELGSLKFPERSLRFTSPDGGHERDQAFITKELPSIEGSGAIMLGGHGMPWEIGTGPRAEDVAKLDLFPAVAFNYACYTGVTKVWTERKRQRAGYLTIFSEVTAKRSFALSMIRAGVTGYVAYVNPRPAGPEMTVDFERVLTGASLGESRRRDYDKIVLGYLAYGEPGVAPPEFVDGDTVPMEKMDPVRNMMLDGAAGGILYGDPALRPYPPHPEALPQQTEARRVGDELHVTMRLAAASAYLWGGDPFRRFEESMAMKLTDRVELPEGLPEIRSVRVESATWGGRSIATLDPVWAIETDRGKRYLQAKTNFARGGRGDIEIRLVASPKAAPPNLAKAADCRKLAVAIGEAILPMLDGIEKPEVYAGKAGVARFLFELAGATGEDRWLRPAKALLAEAAEMKEPPGLYTGLAGVGQVYLDAGRITGDEAYRKEAERIAARLGEPQGTDVIFGASGMGFFLLNLHAATGKKEHLAAARKLGEYLEKLAVRDEDGVRWPVSEKVSRFYPGFSHGAAGAGTFLLALGRATGETRFSALAEEAAAYVISRAVPDGPDGWKWTKTDPPGDEGFRVQWCHGAPGIGLFFLALADETGRPEYEAALARCVAADRRTGRTARGSGIQCHGVSGNAELFLEVWRSRKDPALLAVAREFARDLIGPDGAPKTKIGRFEYGPGYMVGLAGIGQFLLRLADPENVPMAFHLAGGGPDPVMERVRKANEIALRPGADSDRAVAGIADLGERGFRAVCRLIAAGEGHWRTPDLLRATYYPGGEALLIQLADGPELPKYGRWTALSGLGVADTKEVREYLLARLGSEPDAGLFMSAAKALGTLGEARAVEPVARQLLRFEDRWSGVEPHLIGALGQMGKPAAPHLAKFLVDERATRDPGVFRALSVLAALDARRAREVAQVLRKSDRYATFSDPTRARIDRLSK